jgi:hypothetical protein
VFEEDFSAKPKEEDFPTRRLFAQLLKPLLICSSCVLLSTYIPTHSALVPRLAGFSLIT